MKMKKLTLTLFVLLSILLASCAPAAKMTSEMAIMDSAIPQAPAAPLPAWQPQQPPLPLLPSA